MSTALTITREEINEATLQLNVTVSPELVQAGFARAFKKLAKQIAIPGFRPGGAPAHLVEQAVGEREVVGAAADEIVKDALKKALQQEDVQPVASPVVDLTKFERATSEVEFTVKVPLTPIIEIGDYKGIPVVNPFIEITDETVEEQIEQLRRKEGKREAVSGRGIENGDMAVVNIKIEGDEGEGRTFMTIVGQTFPDLDQQIIGMHAEELRNATLTFPSNFQDADWANTTHPCTITIRSVSTMALPELDDEFAKKLKTESVEELRTSVRTRLEQRKAEIQINAVNEQILEELAKRSHLVVATTTWESVANRRLGEIENELRQKGSNLEDYAKSQNMTIDDLQSALRRDAKTHVERAVLIERVFRSEGLEVSNEEANVHFIDVLIENQISVTDAPKFMKEFGDDVREEVYFRAINAKVMGFLRDNAVVTEGVKEEAGAPAPAPAAAEPKKKATKKKAE